MRKLTNNEVDLRTPLLVNKVERVVCERKRRVAFANNVMRTWKHGKHREQETCPKLAYYMRSIETVNNTHPYGIPYSPARGFSFFGFLRWQAVFGDISTR